MEYRWIEDIDTYRDIASEWDEALIQSGNHNPFLLSDFIITWWKHCATKGSGLCVLVMRENGNIVSVLPLYNKRSTLRDGFVRMMSYIGNAAANYTEPLYRLGNTRIVPTLIDALAERNDWDVCYLSDVRGESPFISECQKGIKDKRFIFYTVQDHMNWSIDLSMGKENYLAAISKKLKRDLKAKRKHAVKDYGDLKLREIKGKEGIERYFDLYTEFSLKAFTSRKRLSSFRDKGYTNFFREFLVLMDRAGRLDAHILTGKDTVLAISFAYRFGKGFNWILTGFNYDARYVRPGYLLIEELIHEVYNRGETYYNWYGHPRFYKTQWCNHQTPLYRLFIVKRTPKGLCYKVLKRCEIVLRSNERFVNFARKARDIMHKGKSGTHVDEG